MKQGSIIKKWQLIKWRSKEERADLTESEFVAVGKRAFYKKHRLEEVILPPQASVIKTEAFAGSKRLCKVTLPSDSNVGISSRAFANCVRLRALENEGLISRIGIRAFENCRFLPNLTFGRELKSIGDFAFFGCTSITELELPSCLERMGRGAFLECSELRTLRMEEGITSIGREAFRNCISLEEIELSGAIKELPFGAFRGCSALREVDLPVGIAAIGARAFEDCTRLETVTLEHGVERIGARAFKGADRLRSVIVPPTLKKLGLGAFGFGRSEEKVVLYVENEYMKKRLQTRLRLCLSAGRATVAVTGKTIEERKRERRRATLEQKPTHLFDHEE